MVDDRYLKILTILDRAVRREDYSEIEKVSLEDLKKAKMNLVRERGTAPYALLLQAVEDREKIGLQRDASGCGALSKQNCDMIEQIQKDYDAKRVFLDIPYSNYDDCESVLYDVLKAAGLAPVVAKGRVTSWAMLCKICQSIKTCKYGIADISSGSNSVSYEYGLMHGFGMNVAMLLREASDKFSDITGLEHLPYKDLRSFKLIVMRWILDNVGEAERVELERLISEEDKALRDAGEIQLRNIRDFTTGTEIVQFHLDSIKRLSEKSLSLKKSTGKPTYLLKSFPLLTKGPVTSIKELATNKNSLVVFSGSAQELPTSGDFETTSNSMIQQVEYWKGNPEMYGFSYLEVNVYGEAIWENTFLEFGKVDKYGSKLNIDAINLLIHLYKFVTFVKNFLEVVKHAGVMRIVLFMGNVKDYRIFIEDRFGFPDQIGAIKYKDDIELSADVSMSNFIIDDTVLTLYEAFLAEGNANNSFDRNKSEIALEFAKFHIFGENTCPECKQNRKPLNQEKCIHCRRKELGQAKN